MIEYNKENDLKSYILDIISVLIVNMVVVSIANNIFKNIYVDGVFYIFLVSFLLMVFNVSIKPFLRVFMLPINIYTLGLTYPLINVIVLKLIDLLLGKHFVINGFIHTIIISIFISIMTIIIDNLIGKVIRGVK